MSKQLCDFRGCTNPVPGDYPWQMCDSCYWELVDIEDSEFPDD